MLEGGCHHQVKETKKKESEKNKRELRKLKPGKGKRVKCRETCDSNRTTLGLIEGGGICVTSLEEK